MIFRILRCAHSLPSIPSALLDSCLLVSALLLPTPASFADTVHDHSREHYGRVSSISASGVTLLRGCSGSATEVIPLSNLEEIQFGGKCAPDGLSSSSSPSTAACNGGHGMFFTVVAKSGPNQVVLVVPSMDFSSGQFTLTLRSGQKVSASSSVLQSVYYRDECFSFLRADPVWNSIYTAVR
jgi:hypothetical protein